MKLIKRHVCRSCLSINITDPNCECSHSSEYETVELEFEICECCENVLNDGDPAETDFNYKQMDKYGL